MFIIVEKKSRIDERVSDTTYPKIINIIFNELNKPNVFIPTIVRAEKNKKTIEMVSAKIDKSVVKTTDVWKKVKDSLNKNELEVFEKIFKSINGLDHVLNEFTLFLVPQEVWPNAGGSMSPRGEMTLYFADWKASVKPDKNGIAKDKKAEELMYKLREGGLLTRWRSVFVHEYAHYLNAIRTKDPTKTFLRVGSRSKGGDKQFDITKKEYAQSTEELQARLSEIFDILERLVHLPNTQGINDVEKTILYILATNNKKMFIDYFRQFGTLAYNQHLVDKSFERKVINRLYSSFDEFYNSNTPLMKVLKAHPRLVKPSSFDAFNTWLDMKLANFELKIKKFGQKIKTFFGNED